METDFHYLSLRKKNQKLEYALLAQPFRGNNSVGVAVKNLDLEC